MKSVSQMSPMEAALFDAVERQEIAYDEARDTFYNREHGFDLPEEQDQWVGYWLLSHVCVLKNSIVRVMG